MAVHVFSSLQGERILKLAEMSRKLETEAEKVLPFYTSSLTSEEDDDVAAAMQEAPSEPLAEVRSNFIKINGYVNLVIGLLQLTITWYKIRHTGGQAHYYSPTGKK